MGEIILPAAKQRAKKMGFFFVFLYGGGLTVPLRYVRGVGEGAKLGVKEGWDRPLKGLNPMPELH